MSRTRLVLLAPAMLLTGCGSEPSPGYDPLAAIVPEETADAEALLGLVDWQALPIPLGRRYRLQSSVDRETGEPPPVSFLDRGNRDMNNFVCRGVEAEVADNQLVPLRYDQEACDEGYVRGVVMARFEGPGVLTRFWMTALSIKNQPADDEIIRFYLDDEPVPLVQLPLAALLDGSAGEMFAPPFGAGTSHVAAWHYPVLFRSKLVVALDRLGPLDLYYHQTNVVEIDGSRRRSASRLPERAAAAEALSTPAELPLGELLASAAVTLGPGTTTVADLAGPATIGELTLTFDDADREALSAMRLRVSWDGAPAIDVPLLDLFAATTATPGDGYSLAGSGGSVSLRLPMPFAERALFEVDATQGEADIVLAARGTAALPGEGWRHLRVEHHESVGPTSAPRHPLASRIGPGRLTGVCLMLEGHAMAGGGAFSGALNLLEGDEVGVIDGQGSWLGTGTEDYLDSAFYFAAGPFANPFAQAWGIATDATSDPASGHVSACRWHVLGDAVDYQESLALDLEIGPGDPSVADRYRSVAFVYE